MRVLRTVALAVVVLAGIAALVVYSAGRGWLGTHEAPGTPVGKARPAGVGQILFGDLHVHSTFSVDAFLMSLPLGGGEGAHPPADACDFARYCSALDFWSINDHAEGITPLHWQETVDSIRQCNAIAGDPEHPDVVAYLGWEWSQVGNTPDEHWGHKNVVLRDLEDDSIPARPIGAGGVLGIASVPVWGMGSFVVLSGDRRVADLSRFLNELVAEEACAAGVHTRELPKDCMESAPTPGELFRKLDEWGHASIVIPHGTTWGFATPPGSSWSKQLTPATHDPDRQTLIEIYSGHGDGEVYRSWRSIDLDPGGAPRCPEPRQEYLPSCWRAGELIRERCAAEDHPAAECERRAVAARANAAAAGVSAHVTVPGSRPEEWLDAGQCRDCDQPAFNYRPQGSAQYIAAIRRPGPDGQLMRFQLGFMSSSDNHYARAGTGYKEKHRRGMTESRRGQADGMFASAFGVAPEVEPVARSVPFDRESSGLSGFQLREIERQASFFLTGGLVAVHADGRSRGKIWDALERKEVYGTSGPRILLWFDLLNPPDGVTRPMGSALEMATPPRLRVRAVGSFEQKEGCPDWAASALGPERLERICKGECYHPSDQRRQITRLEVIRIRPQNHPDEPLEPLIDDPWRIFACRGDAEGCSATFEDPEFATAARDAVYYARVYEEPAPGINAQNLRCERDPTGACTKVDLCGGEGAEADDCLAEHEPRAWSSPIFIDYTPPGP